MLATITAIKKQVNKRGQTVYTKNGNPNLILTAENAHGVFEVKANGDKFYSARPGYSIEIERGKAKRIEFAPGDSLGQLYGVGLIFSPAAELEGGKK